MHELAKRVIALAGSSSQVRFSKPDFIDIDIRVPQLQKCTEELGLCPRVELDDALPATIHRYRKHLEDFFECYRPNERAEATAGKA
jgi:hypothetical protein